MKSKVLNGFERQRDMWPEIDFEHDLNLQSTAVKNNFSSFDAV